MNEFRVNFLIVGAQKGGTTALAHYLAQDPRVCMAPSKEVHLFDDPELEGADWGGPEIRARYRQAFPNYAGQSWVGEATPIYLYLPRVAERVRRYNPAMKLIALLREPASRAISQHRHERRLGRESLPLLPALLLERPRLWLHRRDLAERSSLRAHSYTDRGRYAHQLRRLLAHFPRSQLLALRSEDLWRCHGETLEAVYRFLGGAPPSPLPPRQRVHAGEGGGAPRLAASWVAWRCRRQVAELEEMLGWDLAEWKRHPGAPPAAEDEP